MSTADRPASVEYDSETELVQDYQKVMSNPVNVNFATQYLFDQLVDDVILQIVFRAHFESKHPVSEGVGGDFREERVELGEIWSFGSDFEEFLRGQKRKIWQNLLQGNWIFKIF